MQLKTNLPHLHGFPWYQWAWEYFTSTNRMCILTAGNQLSKSSSQIRKCIDWATDKSKWKTLWPNSLTEPNAFWYFYPTTDVASEEFLLKWKQFLPGEEFKNHPQYGWQESYLNKKIYKIVFNSGVTVYFKTYAQSLTDIQTGSIYAIFCFTEKTKVWTKRGRISVKDVVEGDLVLSHTGYAQVSKPRARNAPVAEVVLSSGEVFYATEEHPFFTERGWVSVKDLRTGDVCFKTPAWLNEVVLPILFCLKENYLDASLIQKTIGSVIIGAVERLGVSYTLLYGKHIPVGLFLKTVLSTTTILTLWITISPILFVLHAVSTLVFIKSMNGKLKKSIHACASAVEKILLHAVLSEKLQDIVRKSAAENTLLKDVGAAKKNLNRGLMLNKVFVAKIAQTNENKTVYNFATSEHTYFADGILTHNCDEEMPIEFWPEVQNRLNSTDGYFSSVFTATIGQEFWRKAIEGKGAEENLPTADKWQVTIFDCVTYKDGSPSPWTFEKIKRVIYRNTSNPENQAAVLACESINELYTLVKTFSNEPEVERRALGRFIFVGGLKIETFKYQRNVCPPHPIPTDWVIYGAVDYGGGGTSHPSAMCFLAVSPDYRMGRIFRARRMDGMVTTSEDALKEYIRVRGDLRVVRQVYDFSSKDFHTFATRMGEPFQKAEKDHELGFGTLDTLFKSGMLKIFEGDPELDKLITEICTLKKSTPKRIAADDLIDAMRYNVVDVPWDWSVLDDPNFDQEGRKKNPPAPKKPDELDLRRDYFLGNRSEQEQTVEDEINEWEELLNDIDS